MLIYVTIASLAYHCKNIIKNYVIFIGLVPCFVRGQKITIEESICNQVHQSIRDSE